MGEAADRFAAAQRRLDAIESEQEARRSLRSRQIEASRSQAMDNFAKQGATAQKTVERLQEMGKRQKQAGGWATGSAMRDRSGQFSFGEAEPVYQDPPPRSVAPSAAPAAPSAPPTTPIETQPPAPAPAPATRRRPARPEPDDDDDFSNQSWMR